MQYTVSITSQGQISIPIQIRRKLGLGKTSRAIVSEEKGEILVKPVKDFLEMRGSLKTDKKPLSNEQLHEVVAQAFADEYAKKFKNSK